MNDDFELVPKDLIHDLKKENEELKKKLERREENGPDKKLVPEIKKIIQEEISKERTTLVKEIKEIKELNKSTLNNVLSRTQTLDHKLEDLVSSLNDLLKSLNEVVNEISDSKGHGAVEKMDKLTSKIEELEFALNNKEDTNLEQKLEDIEDFLTKLKVLLSQVKPVDIKLEKE